MSYTYVNSIGDGVTKDFPFSFAGQDTGYLRTSDVKVYVAGIQVSFNINTATPNVASLTLAPPVGAEVLIRRIMPKNVPYSDFSRGNPFSQDTLNNTNLQMLYLLQEIYDGYLPEGFYFRTNIDMRGMKLINLGKGTVSGDSVNYDQLEETNSKLEGLADAVLSGDMTVRNVSMKITSTAGQTSWVPGIEFVNAYLFIQGVWQNKLSGAFDIVNNTIIFSEPLIAGLQVYALLGTGPTLPDDYLTPEELEDLYFDGIYQRLSSVEGSVVDFGGRIQVLETEVTQNGQVITSLSSDMTDVKSRLAAEEIKIQPINLGGTGNTAGRSATATKLDVPRGVRVNLASTAAVNFDGSADITPGVTGVLAKANGGTGTTGGAAAPGINSDITKLTGLTGGIQGDTTGTTALAGIVGEELVAVSSADVTMTSDSPRVIQTLNLTAGDWELSGAITLTPTGGSLSMIAISLGTSAAYEQWYQQVRENIANEANSPLIRPLQSKRVTVGAGGATAQIYGQCRFSSGTTIARGYIRARRIR